MSYELKFGRGQSEMYEEENVPNVQCTNKQSVSKNVQCKQKCR